MKKSTTIWIYPLAIMAALLTLTNSCKKDKTDPVITWADPADIGSGTSLSATQLNATADVPGTFVYTPATGTKLNEGANQDLKVDFTPTDQDAYNTVSKTVKITVTASTGGGSFSLDGITYTIPYGYLGHSNNEFWLTFSDASSPQNVPTAKIEMTFDIISSTGTLDNGTYSYDPNHTTNLIEAFVRLRDGQNEVQWDCVENGSITISKTNNVYDISYTFLADNNGTRKTLTGSFKGTITNY
jgi:hypothetical protein